MHKLIIARTDNSASGVKSCDVFVARYAIRGQYASGCIIARGRSLMCGVVECSTFHVNEPVRRPITRPRTAATSAALLRTQLTPICGDAHPILLQNLRSHKIYAAT